MERNAIEEKARADRVKLNGKGDPELLFFQEMIYSGLAAASEGNVPALQDAFQLSPEDLDAWHLAVVDVNPGWYTANEYHEEQIQIGDRRITVLSLRPSVLMRRMHLEQLAEQQITENENAKKIAFRLMYYPRLAGCSIGDVPSETQARQDWSMEELQAWYDAAKRLIPGWFVSLEESAEQNQQAAQAAKETKKKRRARS